MADGLARFGPNVANGGSQIFFLTKVRGEVEGSDLPAGCRNGRAKSFFYSVE